MTHADLPADARTPRCTHDDKRPRQSPVADIVLAYLRGGALYARQQRDRYQVEYLLDPGPHNGLAWVAMGRNLRLHFGMT